MFVSVIIPAFNCADYINGAIDSVLGQTHENYEVLVVDDGSTDNTAELVSSYRNNKKIKYIYQENGGPSSARNKGICEAKGDVIAFLDSDDLWLPEKLAKQIEIMISNHDVGIVASDYFVIGLDGEEEYPARRNRGYLSFKKIYVKNMLLTSSVLVRKECFDDIGLFNTDYRFGEDWEMWLRIAFKYEIFIIPDQLCGYRRLREGSITSSFSEKNMQDWYDIVMKNWKMVGRSFCLNISHRRALSWYYFNYSFVEEIKGNPYQSRSFLFRSAYAWPFAIYNGKKPVVLICLKTCLSFLFKCR